MVTRRAPDEFIVERDLLPFSRRAEHRMGMPAYTASRYRWTDTEVRALMEATPGHWPRFELMGGELIVTPAPGNVHQVAVGQILGVLDDYISAQGIGVALASPGDLRLLPGTIAQPDVFVAPPGGPPDPEDKSGWSAVKRLLVAVEVISPSSIRTDRVEKRDYYMSAGVPEYWVADCDARVIERWNPERETPTIVSTTLTWRPFGAREPLVMNLAQLFERIWAKYWLLVGR
jgi:Uma2 family endonuclease